MSWTTTLDDLELGVTCGARRHVVRWHQGQVEALDHPDLDAERALLAFGGDEPPCLAVLSLWNEAVDDGGFLGEWAEGDFDSSRLWWLGMALERMRSEGFHEFLRDLPLPRANRMGRFLTAFPPSWIDRAAAEVAAREIDGTGVVCGHAGRLIDQAVARRLRRSFVLSVGGRQTPLGAAALVPFEPVVLADSPPAVEGRLRGRSSWVRVTVDRRWLFEVWGAGAAVIDGSLAVALDPEPNSPRATVVRWSADGDGVRPELETMAVDFSSGPRRCWIPRDQSARDQ